MGYMTYGGIQKSLIDFLSNIIDKVDVDLLLWGRADEEMPIPNGVNILKKTTVKSVRAAIKENGFLSRTFILSLIGAFKEKRWCVMPKIKKRYDIAISYTHVGAPKYFVIDRVNAEKKYTFYHHGAYENTGKLKEWDEEYYRPISRNYVRRK